MASLATASKCTWQRLSRTTLHIVQPTLRIQRMYVATHRMVAHVSSHVDRRGSPLARLSSCHGC